MRVTRYISVNFFLSAVYGLMERQSMLACMGEENIFGCVNLVERRNSVSKLCHQRDFRWDRSAYFVFPQYSVAP